MEEEVVAMAATMGATAMSLPTPRTRAVSSVGIRYSVKDLR